MVSGITRHFGFGMGVNGYASPQSDSSQAVSEIYKQAVASPIRTDDDRNADAKRKPLEFLQFTNVRPGMRVLDIAAGGGYTTQLLALVVGSNGTVWAQGTQSRQHLRSDWPVIRRLTSFRLFGLSKIRYPMVCPSWI